MEPVRLTDEEFDSLPASVRRTLAEDQPQYRPLPVVLLEGSEGRTISRWSLTNAERKAIADGADLYLQQLTFGDSFQPILPTIGLPEFCPADSVGSSAPEEISDEQGNAKAETAS